MRQNLVGAPVASYGQIRAKCSEELRNRCSNQLSYVGLDRSGHILWHLPKVKRSRSPVVPFKLGHYQVALVTTTTHFHAKLVFRLRIMALR